MVDVVADVRRKRRLYRIGNISLQEFRLWLEDRCRFIFQLIGYALGHADGVNGSDEADEGIRSHYRSSLRDIEGMEPGWLISDTRSALQPVLTQEAERGLDFFDPLNRRRRTAA